MATILFLLQFVCRVFFCLLSLLSAVVLGWFDRRASKIMNRAEAKTGMSLLLLCDLIGHFLFVFFC